MRESGALGWIVLGVVAFAALFVFGWLGWP
jgi:hypothetical protein